MTDDKFCCSGMLDTLTGFIKMKISLDRIFSPITQKYGLTPIQSMTLNLISNCEKPTVSSVFRTLELNQGNVSSMCKKLESDGFIIRRKSPEDERSVTLQITEKGRLALVGIGGEIKKITESGEILTDGDIQAASAGIEALSSLARKVTAAVDKLDIE